MDASVLSSVFAHLSAHTEREVGGASNWRYLASGGHSSGSYLSDSYVLQARPIEQLEREVAQQQIIDVVRESLPGANCRFGNFCLEHEDGGFVAGYFRDAFDSRQTADAARYWTLQDRLPGVVINAAAKENPADPLTVFEETIAQTYHELAVLADSAKTTPEHTLSALAKAPLTRGLNFQVMPRNALLQIVRSTFGADVYDLWESVPMKNSSPLVVSHGDPILKNVVVLFMGSQRKSHLIDWETVSVIPRHCDLVHAIVYLLKYQDSDQEWPRILSSGWASARCYLEEWSEEDFITMTMWGLVREVLAYPAYADKERAHQTVRRAFAYLKSLSLA